jgi:hypothetical protein
MFKIFRIAGLFAASATVASCTSLYFVHDPQTGVITAGELPNFIQSVRCELLTFYAVERMRKVSYDRVVKKDPAVAFSNFAYFDLAPTLYGAFTLELKVTDSLGIGAGTAIDSKKVLDSTHSNTWHFGPTASGQGTYDLIWTFLMRQDASPSVAITDSVRAATTAPEITSYSACFSGPTEGLEGLERLAENTAPERARFNRIFVNGQKPLAAWLRDNGTLMSANYLTAKNPIEGAEAAQMYYSFAVQVSAGLDVKYTVLTPAWNPLAADASGSLQQNSNLQIYINGQGALVANGAKSGSAVWTPPSPPLGSAARPMHVIEERPAQIQGTQPRRRGAPLSPLNKGYLLAPVPVFPPSPSQ